MAKAVSEQLNQRLAETSQALFGERARLRIVDPKDVRLVGKNARYMNKQAFDQLASNIEHDGFLSSVPLCHELEDGALEALSGNHRIKAAVRAGVERILVIALPRQADSRKTAIQLSHNALQGNDDRDLLAELWAGLESLDEKLYSGLDSETVSDLNEARLAGFSPAQPRTMRVILWFLPEEVTALDELLDEAEAETTADPRYVAPAAHYNLLIEALKQVKQSQNIKNTAVAFMWLMNRLAGKTVFDAIEPN